MSIPWTQRDIRVLTIEAFHLEAVFFYRHFNIPLFITIGDYLCDIASTAEENGISIIRCELSGERLMDEDKDPMVRHLVVGDWAPALWMGNAISPFLVASPACNVTFTKRVEGEATMDWEWETVDKPSKCSWLPVRCKEGYYALPGEECKECPAGARCPGGLQDSQSLPGFWRDSRTNYTMCSPPEACAGGDNGSIAAFQPCAVGYTGVGCSPPPCAEGYYLMSGKCHECPEIAWLLILIACIMILLVILLLIWADRKRINLVGLRVGIDFLQILATFKAFHFQWPMVTETVLSIGHAAGLDLEILAPECSMKFDYWQKWAFTQSLPLVGIAGVFGAAVLAKVVKLVFRGLSHLILQRHTCCRRNALRKRKARAVVLGLRDSVRPTVSQITLFDRLLGVLFSFFYVIYFVVIRNGFAILDCASVQTTSGYKTVLEGAPSIECGSELHLQLIPWSVASLLLYGIGIPLLFLSLLLSKRKSIIIDQRLRQRGEGNTELSNPVFKTRIRYGKLYGDFRPQYYYWKVVLLIRKLLLVVNSIMISNLPLLQAAAVILLLVMSYSLHVNLYPFLLKQSISSSFLEKGRSGLMKPSVAITGPRRMAFQSKTVSLARQALASSAAKFVYDFNRLEAVYLAQSTLILLFGMVYQVRNCAIFSCDERIKFPTVFCITVTKPAKGLSGSLCARYRLGLIAGVFNFWLCGHPGV